MTHTAGSQLTETKADEMAGKETNLEKMERLQDDSNNLQPGEKPLLECKGREDMSPRQLDNFKAWNNARLMESPAYTRKHGLD